MPKMTNSATSVTEGEHAMSSSNTTTILSAPPTNKHSTAAADNNSGSSTFRLSSASMNGTSTSAHPQRLLPPYLIDPQQQQQQQQQNTPHHSSINNNTEQEVVESSSASLVLSDSAAALLLSSSISDTEVPTTRSSSPPLATTTTPVVSPPRGLSSDFSVQEGTPAHDAIQANAAIKVRRISKVARKLQVPQVIHAVKKTGSSVINPNLKHKGKKPPRIPITLDMSADTTIGVPPPPLPRLSEVLEHEEEFSSTNNNLVDDADEISEFSPSSLELLHREGSVEDGAEQGNDSVVRISISSSGTITTATAGAKDVGKGEIIASSSGEKTIHDSLTFRPTMAHRRAKTEGYLLGTDLNAANRKKPTSNRKLLFAGSTPNKNVPSDQHTKSGDKKVSSKTSRPSKTKAPKVAKKKKSSRESYVKGKVIDRQHELYTLSLAVMLGLRTSIGMTNTILQSSAKQQLLKRLSASVWSSNETEHNTNPRQYGRKMSSGGSFLAMLKRDQFYGTHENPTKTTHQETVDENNPPKSTNATNTTTDAATTTDHSKWLDSYDFMAVEKYVFRPKGGPSTPPHQLSHTFKFKDYSPKAFAYIRRLCGINESEFLSSVCGNANYIQYVSNAKSGQFFFYSSDGKYMIKTMSTTESKFLRRILPQYFRHCVKYPDTLICKFLGMYRVKLYHLRSNVKFIVMNSVFDTDKFLSKFYDLKGSVIGREAKPGENVRKDNDLRKEMPSSRMNFDPELRERLRNQIAEDCNFLKSMKIMDYSMLVGVHQVPRSRCVQLQAGTSESFLKDSESSRSLLGDNAVERKNILPNDPASPIANRPIFRDADSNCAVIAESSKLHCSSPERENLSFIVSTQFDSPIQYVSSPDRSFAKLSRSRSLSCSLVDDGVYEDDDNSYLEDSYLHSHHKACESKSSFEFTNVGSSHTGVVERLSLGKEALDPAEVNLEISTEKLYWPFHRFYNINGQRRIQPHHQFQNDEAGLLPEGVDSHGDGVPLFVKPISNRKDKGFLSKSNRISVPTENPSESDQLEQESIDYRIYYIGIIDVLQQFNLRKRVEAKMRTFQGDTWLDASCVHPDLYADRFLKFFDEITLSNAQNLSKIDYSRQLSGSDSDVSYEEILFLAEKGET